jgi:hypothetical protein
VKTLKKNNKGTYTQKKLKKINNKRKKLLKKSNEKLNIINFSIIKLLKQMILLKKNKMIIPNKTFEFIKNDNLIKLSKLYSIKSKIIKLKKLKIKKLKIKILKIKKLKIKKLKIKKLKRLKIKKSKIKKLKLKKVRFKFKKYKVKLTKKINFSNLIKKKISLIIFFIEKRKKALFILKKKKALSRLKKMNKNKLIKENVIKLIKLKLKLTKLKLKLTKVKLNKLKLKKLSKLKYNIPLRLIKRNYSKKIIFAKNKLRNKKIKKLTVKVTEQAIKKNNLKHIIARKKFWRTDRAAMKEAIELNKKDTQRFYRFIPHPKKTDFFPTMSYETLKQTKTFRVQQYYREHEMRIDIYKSEIQNFPIPRKKGKKKFFSKEHLYRHQKVKKYKVFSIVKYSSFFKLLLKTRLKLFKYKKKKNNFNFLFLNKLKNSIKNILFKNKSSYYNLIQSSLNGMNFYNEYKLWHLHFIKLKKIPFNLIRLYSKFYFNKIFYNLKLKSNFYFLYYKYLQARTKVKYFKIKQAKKAFNKNKMRSVGHLILYKFFKFSMKFFLAAKSKGPFFLSAKGPLFSLIRNGAFYSYYKLHEISRHKIRKNPLVSTFLITLKKKDHFMSQKELNILIFFLFIGQENFMVIMFMETIKRVLMNLIY